MTTANWLDDALGNAIIQNDGVAFPKRGSLNFIGGVVEDDPENNRINYTPAGGLANSATVIFRPGGVTAGLVVTTFAAACAAAAASGGPARIIFDDSIQNIDNTAIPSGTYNFGTLTTFEGSPNGADGLRTTIAPADGAVFTHPIVGLSNTVLATNASIAALMSSMPSGFRLVMRNSVLYPVGGTKAIFDVTASNVQILMLEGSAINNSFVTTTAFKSTNDLTIYIGDGTIIQNSIISIVGALTYVIAAASVTPSMVQTYGSLSVVGPNGSGTYTDRFSGTDIEWTALSGNAGTANRRRNVTTTNATPVVVASTPNLTVAGVYTVTFRLQAFRSGGPSAATCKLEGSFRSTGAALVQIDTVAPVLGSSNEGAAAFALTVTGNQVNAQFTGVAAQTWTCKVVQEEIG